MKDTKKYKRVTKEIIPTLVDKSASSTGQKILEMIVKDVKEEKEKKQESHLQLNSAVGSFVNMK